MSTGGSERSGSDGSLERFVLLGSPHSIPTYKVALMLALCGAGFEFRYVSFQRGMHRDPRFLEISRWGQVPVLKVGETVLVQSAAIVDYVSGILGKFGGLDENERRATREWAFWDADVLFPPIFACYGVYLGEKNLLPIEVDPHIAGYHRRRAEAALAKLDAYAPKEGFLCGPEPTFADVLCFANLPYAELCGFDASTLPRLQHWAERVSSLDGFRLPFELLEMKDIARVG